MCGSSPCQEVPRHFLFTSHNSEAVYGFVRLLEVSLLPPLPGLPRAGVSCLSCLSPTSGDELGNCDSCSQAGIAPSWLLRTSLYAWHMFTALSGKLAMQNEVLSFCQQRHWPARTPGRLHECGYIAEWPCQTVICSPPCPHWCPGLEGAVPPWAACVSIVDGHCRGCSARGSPGGTWAVLWWWTSTVLLGACPRL